ncbi:hypothetical protein EVAR_95755_1 [Eumeta japonica]|uniref:Retrovirus-related Pol polyprotein from transposon TNT 1-94 n=1 Tax=Eumeta variegata TaxID=151549 RepID=A0A4C1UKW8_EUMVA|nr:hypothetical protein EVAR_95755_1 [Eumeta japonica]
MTLSPEAEDIISQESVESLPEKRVRRKPDFYQSANMCVEMLDEHISLSDAMNGSEKDQWQSAMQQELESFRDNDSWELVDRPSEGTIVKNKWVFKKKHNTEGEGAAARRLSACQPSGIEIGIESLARVRLHHRLCASEGASSGSAHDAHGSHVISNKKIERSFSYSHQIYRDSCPTSLKPNKTPSISKQTKVDESRGKQTGEPSESRWSPPLIDTRNTEGVTNVLPASWEGTGFPMEGNLVGGRREALALTGRDATAVGGSGRLEAKAFASEALVRDCTREMPISMSAGGQ